MRVGDKVQAVDELGRWEDGRLMNIRDDEGSKLFEIHFTGWTDEFDREVSEGEVRMPINFADIEMQKLPGRRQKPRSSKRNLNAGRILTAGDEVVFSDDGKVCYGIAVTIDRYCREVDVEQNGTRKSVRFEDIIVKEDREPLTKRRKQCKTTKLSCSEPFQQRDDEEAPVSEESTEVISTEKQNLPLAWCGELFEIGQTVEVKKSGGVSVLISNIVSNGMKTEVAGLLLVNDTVDCDVTVSSNIDRFKAKHHTLNKDGSKLSKKLREASYELHCDKTCNAIRRSLLQCHLKREIDSALKSRIFRRKFSLGVANYGDLCLFPGLSLSKRSVSYEYSDNSLCHLDLLLGNRWDISTVSEKVTFVTKIQVRVSKEYILVGSVKTALFKGAVESIMDGDYREHLNSYIEMESDEDISQSEPEN